MSNVIATILRLVLVFASCEGGILVLGIQDFNLKTTFGIGLIFLAGSISTWGDIKKRSKKASTQTDRF